MSTAAKVAIEKRSTPERFCPFPRCLWRTMRLNRTTGQHEGGGFCPRHRPHPEPESPVLDWIRKGYQLPGKPTAEAKLP
jgi:hypothetical protein